MEFAAAESAARFKGWYPIMQEGQVSAQVQEYMLIDVDTLENIWMKYSQGDLPENLEDYRYESTIIGGFTHNNFLILAFEAFAFVTERYLKIDGSGDMLLELYLRDDGNFNGATRENTNIFRYLFAPPLAMP